MPARPVLPLAALCATLALSGCGGGDSGSSSTAGAVAVEAGDSTCSVAQTSFDAPRDVTFAVSNTGSTTTEVYVYGKGSDGGFDKVVGEVEDVAPGLDREFSVDLGSGAYEVACKPGSKGDGIRTPITVGGTSTGSSAEAAYDREVEVVAKDFAFTGLEGFTGKVGEKIEFKLENQSASMEHELEIFAPDGSVLGEVGPTAPGEDGEVVLTLSAPGTYRYVCGIDDHEQRGMVGTFTVA